MTNKFCELCNAPIGEKYRFCLKCSMKLKEQPAIPEIKDETVNHLQKINNNLYAIRTILEYNLLKDWKKKLIWDKISKKFDVQ